MQAGVPVVASQAGSLPEVLGDAAALVAVGQSDQLAAVLAKVLTDQVYRQSLIAAGRTRAARFGWEACGEGLAQLYRRVDEARRV